jgi:hypothetical protein
MEFNLRGTRVFKETRNKYLKSVLSRENVREVPHRSPFGSSLEVLKDDKEKSHERQCQDKCFLVFFMIGFLSLVITILIVHFRSLYVEDITSMLIQSTMTSTMTTFLGQLFESFSLSLIVTIILVIVWILTLSKQAKFISYSSVLTIPLMTIVSGYLIFHYSIFSTDEDDMSEFQEIM